MWSKTFASMYEGSMAGSGPVVFAVWGYIIANTSEEHVLLNPPIVCMKIGIEREQFDQAIEFLSSPDPNSQSEEEEGRRIIHSSGHQWFVVNSKKYQDFKTAKEKAEYNRIKQQESRARKKGNVSICQIDSLTVKSVNDSQTIEEKRLDDIKNSSDVAKTRKSQELDVFGNPL